MTHPTRYRLADSTAIEPLVHGWPAWSYLIAPVPASLHLLQYQLPLLQSYVDNPSLHEAACRDLELASGAFVNIPERRAPEVATFLERTQRVQRESIELATQLLEFDTWLNRQADGRSIEPFYAALPAALRGCVELVYDYRNRPSIRCIEGLLYRSRYYRPDLQSLRLSVLNDDASRPFFLNTPRLPEPDAFEVQTPFDAPSTRRLFALDDEGEPLEAICEILGVDPKDGQRLLPLLSTAPRVRQAPWREASVRVRYFGHACVLLESNGVSVLTDPCLGVRPLQGGADRFSYHDLPEHIDYAVITHNHQDHACVETLLRLRHRIGCLVVPRAYGYLYGDISLKLVARHLGFTSIAELDALESLPIPNGEIVAVPFLGEHSDLPHGKAAWMIRLGGRRMLAAADSDCLDPQLYENVRQAVGAIDTVFLGTESVGAPLMWINGCLLPERPTREQDETRRQHGCDAARAVALLDALGASRLYNYAMGMEPWMQHILGLAMTDDAPQMRESNTLLAETRRRGFIAAERLFGKAEFVLDEMDHEERSFVARSSRARPVAPATTQPIADPAIDEAGRGHDFVFDES
jgi:L-ascorbate metabolism protein UlaG (beta-lactamase superfamily)